MERHQVLIVEDHAPTSQAVASLFRRKGWDVRTSATLAEGLAALDPPPDCLILDLMLPDGGGEDILRTVREEKLPTRVVAVATGSSDSSRRTEVLRLRPELLVSKPIDWEVLWRYCESEMRR